MGRFTIVIVAAASLLLALPPAAGAQALGQLFIEVLDESGEPVLDLRPDDFTIKENGEDVRVESAELDLIGREPMKVALLVHNGVMTGIESLDLGAANPLQGGPVPGIRLDVETAGDTGAVNQLRAGIVTFLDELPPAHEVGLFTIGGTIRRRADFTTDRDELKEAAERVFVEQSPGVIMLDGVKETWERRYDDGDRFPVFVLVLTDGPEGSSSYSEDDYVDLMTDLVQNNVHDSCRPGVDAGGQHRQSVRHQHDGDHRRHLREPRVEQRIVELAGADRDAHGRPLRSGVDALPRDLPARGSAGRSVRGVREP